MYTNSNTYGVGGTGKIVPAYASGGAAGNTESLALGQGNAAANTNLDSVSTLGGPSSFSVAGGHSNNNAYAVGNIASTANTSGNV